MNMIITIKRLLYKLGILQERRAYQRTNTCDRLSYLSRTSHY